MEKKKPFSRLKKAIEALFEPSLKMEFCCTSYPLRGQQGRHNSVPRFYVKLGKEIIWDYPKDFEAKDIHFGLWADYNRISELVQEYIDTRVDKLMKKKFKLEKQRYINQYLGTNFQETIEIDLRLTELFKAADRRLGKRKLLNWAIKERKLGIDKILCKRFGYADPPADEERRKYYEIGYQDRVSNLTPYDHRVFREAIAKARGEREEEYLSRLKETKDELHKLYKEMMQGIKPGPKPSDDEIVEMVRKNREKQRKEKIAKARKEYRKSLLSQEFRRDSSDSG